MAPDFDNDDQDVSDIDRVLFCFAVEQEAKFFSYPGMEVIITGIGRENAERRLHSALHRYHSCHLRRRERKPARRFQRLYDLRTETELRETGAFIADFSGKNSGHASPPTPNPVGRSKS